MMRKPLLSICLILSLSSTATVHEVEVNDNSFSPRNLSIEAGDTVRWQNYGHMLHNVASEDINQLFRCAQGCDDSGGNGNIAGNGWISEVTFHRPSSTIPYVCEPHVGFGMTGSVFVATPTVNATITVDVANGFVPNELTLPLGSRILVENGGGEHNFHAVDDSFQCAEGCRDDGIEGFNGPTGFPWANYHILDQAGTITYQCQNPEHNETGVIHVIDYPIFAHGFEAPE